MEEGRLFGGMELHSNNNSNNKIGVIGRRRGERNNALNKELQQSIIHLPSLKALCFLGCPDEV